MTSDRDVTVKLKYHRLKPGGISDDIGPGCNCEIEAPPAKVGGVKTLTSHFLALNL